MELKNDLGEAGWFANDEYEGPYIHEESSCPPELGTNRLLRDGSCIARRRTNNSQSDFIGCSVWPHFAILMMLSLAQCFP